MQITITEALAELKTIQKRVEKKQQFVLTYLTRQEGLKDPFEKNGGSVELLRRELQSIDDLRTRHLRIRTAIQHKNHAVTLAISNTTFTIAEWLTWRKELAPSEQSFVSALQRQLAQVRVEAQRKGAVVVGDGGNASKPSDVLVNIDEQTLAKRDEDVTETLGVLDGKLSLLNATTQIELQD